MYWNCQFFHNIVNFIYLLWYNYIKSLIGNITSSHIYSDSAPFAEYIDFFVYRCENKNWKHITCLRYIKIAFKQRYKDIKLIPENDSVLMRTQAHAKSHTHTHTHWLRVQIHLLLRTILVIFFLSPIFHVMLSAAGVLGSWIQKLEFVLP